MQAAAKEQRINLLQQAAQLRCIESAEQCRELAI